MLFTYLILANLVVNQVRPSDIYDSDELLVDVDLPESHLSQYFNHLPTFAKQINETTNGPYKEFLSSERYDREVCWGYEQGCKKPQTCHRCPGNHTGYVQSKEAQLDVFYTQADFGELKTIENSRSEIQI
jgi:hypothetical protein